MLVYTVHGDKTYCIFLEQVQLPGINVGESLFKWNAEENIFPEI